MALKNTVLVALCALFTAAGCDSELNINPQYDYRRLLNVFCILRLNQDRQWATIERTFGMEEPISNVFAGKVSTARVRISGGGQDIILKTLPIRPGYYYTDSLEVKPGQTYRLEVFDSFDGTLVTGETTVPGPFKITSPSHGKYSRRTEFNVSWTESPYSAHYVINLRYKQGFKWSGAQYFTTRKTGYRLFPQLFEFTGDYLIEVLAVDENYFLYTLGNTGSESTQERPGVEGGLGVFGSAAADSVHIIIEHPSIYYEPSL